MEIVNLVSEQSPTITEQTFKLNSANVVEKALEVKTDIPLNEFELAKIEGFNDSELEMLKIFWKPCFNSEWIYLSDEIILEFLTNDTSKIALSNFYTRILISNYREEIDYKEVSFEDELVKVWFSKLRTEKSTRKPPSNKKYYIVSGETYKCLLMSSKSKKGQETRYYYIKVETLAIKMKDYLFEFLKRENNLIKLENELKLKEKDQEIKKITQNHEQYLKKKMRTPYEKGNVVYVLSNKAFFTHYGDDYYKIGKATQKSNENVSAFMKRLSTYNTGSPDNYDVNALFYIDDNEFVEKSIKLKFAKHMNPSNKEWIKGIKLDVIVDFIREECKLIEIEYKEINITPEMMSECLKSEIIKDEDEEVEEDTKEEEVENKEEKYVKLIKEIKEEIKDEIREEIKNRGSGKCVDCDKKIDKRSLRCIECHLNSTANKCVDCDTKIYRGSSRCSECAVKNRSCKPGLNTLTEDLRTLSRLDVSRKYNVTKRTILNWIKEYNMR
jgi:hypothetical protein